MQENIRPWQLPSREDLLRGVRQILTENPERHDQGTWLGNAFASILAEYEISTDKARQYVLMPVPDRPVNEDEDAPACGTTGCIAGWTVILGSPPGTRITPELVVRDPDGSLAHIFDRARALLGLDIRQAAWLFSPDRDRGELIADLGRLIQDPDAPIWRYGPEDDPA